MDIWKFFAVGHRNHVYCNPMSEAKFDEIIERLALPEGASVLDIACGKAELLVRCVQRWGCTGVGVDQSPFFVADARARVAEAGVSDAVTIEEGEGSEYEAAPESVDAASCIGASWIFGGHAETLARLAEWVRPGGLVIAGEPCWLKEPDPAYLKATGLAAETFDTHHGNVRVGLEQGLRFLYAVAADTDDWDRYEGLQCDAAERYAQDHPEDADVPAILHEIRKRRDEYLRFGRDGLGWAVYVFLKDVKDAETTTA